MYCPKLIEQVAASEDVEDAILFTVAGTNFQVFGDG